MTHLLTYSLTQSSPYPPTRQHLHRVHLVDFKGIEYFELKLKILKCPKSIFSPYHTDGGQTSLCKEFAVEVIERKWISGE